MSVDIIARALAAKALGGGGAGSGCDCKFENENPTVYEVGGIPAGTVLTGKTLEQIITMMLFGESAAYPTLIPPTFTVTMDQAYSTIGASVVVTGTAVFDRGSISPAYGTSGFRAGAPTSYVVNGSEFATTATTYKFSTTLQVQPGDNTFTVVVHYSQGEQPKDGIGNDYDSPYPAGSMSQTITITGTFPIHTGTSDDGLKAEDVNLQFDEDGVLEVTMPAEISADDNQKIAFPTDFTPPILGVQQYDESRGVWDWIYGSPEASLTAFTQNSTVIKINDIDVNYTVWSNAMPQLGERKLKFFTKLPDVESPPIYVNGGSGNMTAEEIEQAFENDGRLEVGVGAETGSVDKQSIAFPSTSLPTIVGIQQYDPSRQAWDWIYGSPEASLTAFDVTQQTLPINGQPVEYTVFTNNMIKMGERTLRFFSVLPEGE